MSDRSKSAYDAKMVAQEARKAFPEYFTGKTDEDIIHERFCNFQP